MTSQPEQTEWTPANDAEQQIWDALADGDAARAMGILAAVPLYLPGFPDRTDGQQRLVTRLRDGVPYVLLFTSPAGMQEVARADGWRETNLTELVRVWPGLNGPHGLAINPATPIGVLVTPDRVPTLLPAPDQLGAFLPANTLEELLQGGMAQLDGEVLLDALVTARVTVLTRAVELDGVWMVPVFSSPGLCADFLQQIKMDVPAVELDLVEVLQRWPDPSYRLSLNPGSPVGFSLGGDRVPALLAHAAVLVRRLDGGDRDGIVPGPLPEAPAPLREAPATPSEAPGLRQAAPPQWTHGPPPDASVERGTGGDAARLLRGDA